MKIVHGSRITEQSMINYIVIMVEMKWCFIDHIWLYLNGNEYWRQYCNAVFRCPRKKFNQTKLYSIFFFFFFLTNLL